MKQLERITFELNILKEAVVLVQENIAMQDIPPARGEQILGKYQTRIHHLSTSIVHQHQRQNSSSWKHSDNNSCKHIGPK
jgi:hypothetical protein